MIESRLAQSGIEPSDLRGSRDPTDARLCPTSPKHERLEPHSARLRTLRDQLRLREDRHEDCHSDFGLPHDRAIEPSQAGSRDGMDHCNRAMVGSNRPGALLGSGGGCPSLSLLACSPTLAQTPSGRARSTLYPSVEMPVATCRLPTSRHGFTPAIARRSQGRTDLRGRRPSTPRRRRAEPAYLAVRRFRSPRLTRIVRDNRDTPVLPSAGPRMDHMTVPDLTIAGSILVPGQTVASPRPLPRRDAPLVADSHRLQRLTRSCLRPGNGARCSPGISCMGRRRRRVPDGASSVSGSRAAARS